MGSRHEPPDDDFDVFERLDEDEGEDWADEDLDNTYLAFQLHKSEYAIKVAHVREIVRLPKFIEVPDVPEYICGVVNLRGHVVPLMDARKRLGLPPADYTDRTVAIVLESEGTPTGLVADGVNGVAEIPSSAVDTPPPSRKASIGGRPVIGVAKLDDSVVIILDASLLIRENEERSIGSDVELGQLASPTTPQERP